MQKGVFDSEISGDGRATLQINTANNPLAMDALYDMRIFLNVILRVISIKLLTTATKKCPGFGRNHAGRNRIIWKAFLHSLGLMTGNRSGGVAAGGVG